MIIGHNPGFEDLASDLVVERTKVKKAGWVRLAFDEGNIAVPGNACSLGRS